jgi:uncharacterized membrane protein YphA (DoxX/SURF4 family)
MIKVQKLAVRTWEACQHRYVILVCRLGVGITFIISGMSKLPEGTAFVKEVEKYRLLPDALANAYGSALPWVEIILGSLLILGLVSRVTAGIGFLTALSLVIANSVVLYRGLNLECGCFGGLAELQTRDAIIIDSILLIVTFLILMYKGKFISLDSFIFPNRKSEPAPDE